jgi:hypothetical protein
MLLHLPVNHHLRPLYRALAGLAGLYVLVFGILGFARSRGLPLFAQPYNHHLPWVLGLRTNPAFSILSILAGLVVLIGVVVGRNLDHYIGMVAGAVFFLSGMAMMTLLQTHLNLLGFSMVNCIASFLIGLVFATAGLYSRIGSTDDASGREAQRHGEVVAQH